MTIDWWTLGFQTVNVAILIWLLGHFFWRPVAAMIEARREATQKLIDEAAATKAEADQALADIETTRAGFASERETLLAAARKDADTAHAARLAQAETEAAAMQAAAKAMIAKDRTASEASWADRSCDLAVAIAERLAGRLDGAFVDTCFLDWLVAEIVKLPEASRDAAVAKDVKLEATTAGVLDAAARKRMVASIGDALGGVPHITFRTDPALIAGIELHGDHLVVDSSWRADLGAIRANLSPKPEA